MSYLFSAFYLTLVVVLAVVFFAIALVLRLVTGPFDKRLVVLNYFSHFWGAAYFWCMPYWSLQIKGRHHAKPGQPYVIVSNHLSAIDVLVPCLLFIPFKWVSKIENFRIPFIGWGMSLNRYVPIRRGGLSSIKAMMQQARAHLKQGSSIFIFPEGARSDDGNLKTFKTGAFKLAQEMNVPVLPVVLTGTAEALPKRSLHFKGRHQIGIEVLPAIEAAQHQSLSLNELTELAHEQIAAALAREATDSRPIDTASQQPQS